MAGFNKGHNDHYKYDSRSVAILPGGGTNVVISAYLVDSHQRAAEEPFHKSFDSVAAVSAGTPCAAGLWPLEATGRPLMDSTQIREFCETRLSGAFTKNWWSLGGLIDNKYDMSRFEKILNETFGSIKLSDYANGLNIYVTDLETNKLLRLSSDQAKLDPTQDFYIKDLVRAAISAPTYFDTVRIRNMAGEEKEFLDAGVTASDPSLVEYFAVEHETKNLTMTVFGTGNTHKTRLKSDQLNGGILDAGGNTVDTIFRSVAATQRDMLTTRLGPRFNALDIDLSGADLSLIETDTSKIIPYAEQAVRENSLRIIQSIEAIHEMRGPALAKDASPMKKAFFDAHGGMPSLGQIVEDALEDAAPHAEGIFVPSALPVAGARELAFHA